MNKRTRTIVIIIAVVIVLAGIGILLYPAIDEWLLERNQSEVIADYRTHINDIDDKNAQLELERAKRYNKDLTDTASLIDPFSEEGAINNENYNSLLNFTQEGVMAYVEIPKIDVLLPIYHGVSTSVLAKGVGHISETSLPVGGESTHCVLAGHSGMSNARLFTDITKLEIGDVFYIHVYNKTMTYTVDQIKRVVPSDTSDLTIVPGEDYVTLVTCVPVTVNSHRLLVRGTRTE